MSAPTITLYFNAASPFARKVLVLLHDTAQLDRVQLQPTVVTPV
ncbi:glutathione S-transferase, partial [Pseudomonas syringae pv. tagetis]